MTVHAPTFIDVSEIYGDEIRAVAINLEYIKAITDLGNDVRIDLVGRTTIVVYDSYESILERLQVVARGPYYSATPK